MWTEFAAACLSAAGGLGPATMRRTCGCRAADGGSERNTLRRLLAINGLTGVIEATASWPAQSTGLLADSLDLLADASECGAALYAVD